MHAASQVRIINAITTSMRCRQRVCATYANACIIDEKMSRTIRSALHKQIVYIIQEILMETSSTLQDYIKFEDRGGQLHYIVRTGALHASCCK